MPEAQSAPFIIDSSPSASATELMPARPPQSSSEPIYNGSSTQERMRSARKTDGRYAEPEYQDGRYGFGPREEKMDVDPEESRELPRDNRRNDRYSSRYDDRQGRGHGYQRDDRRDGGSYGRESGRRYGNDVAPEPKRLYSDGLYSHQRGHGFR